MRFCGIEGCNGKYEAKNFCKRHYKSFKRYGDPLYSEKRKLQLEESRMESALIKEKKRILRSTEGTCLEQGCNEPIQSRKLCKLHYGRHLRNGNLKAKHSFNKVNTDKCLAINCENPHKRHGLCTRHLTNVKELKSPYRPKTVKLCGAKNCKNPHYAYGLCKQHLFEWKQVVRQHELHNYLQLKGQ